MTASRVLDVVRTYPRPVVIDWAAVDVSEFLGACEAHRVACLLGPTLASAEQPPTLATHHYRMVELRRAFARARTDRDLAVVEEAFREAAIPWVVLKGPTLIAQLYDGGPRESSDLDLLVDGADVERALDHLIAAGASMIDQNFELLRSMGSGEIAIKLPNGTVGDLHWHPIHEYRVRKHFTLGVAQMLDTRVLVAASPNPIPALDADDTLLYLCLHACLSGGERFLWAKDIDLAVRKLGWNGPSLVQRARTAGVGLPVAVMLSRTSSLMRTPVDRPLLRQLAGRSGWLATLRLADHMLGRSGARPSPLLRLMYRSTRATSTESVREFARACVYNTVLRRRVDQSRPWRVMGPQGQHPALVETSPGLRGRFFDDVRNEVERQGSN